MLTPVAAKYKTLLAMALGTDKFDMYRVQTGQRFSFQKDEKIHLGAYELIVTGRERPVASWGLYQMINCCGVCVSTKAMVDTEYQRRGLGTILNNLRMDVARDFGFSVLLCTDNMANEPQRKILAHNGWKDIWEFVNKRTMHRVAISVINL